MPLCTKIVESCETDAVVGSLNQMHMNRCRLSCACEKLYADVNQRAVTTAAFAHFIQHAATTPPVLNPSFPKTSDVPNQDQSLSPVCPRHWHPDRIQ